jgi:hypothetical protein
MRTLLGHGLLLDGHDTTPSRAREAAQAWLLSRGVDAFDAEAATEQAPCGRAWWCGDDIGFGQAHHDGAQPVTVVHLPDQLLVEGDT